MTCTGLSVLFLCFFLISVAYNTQGSSHYMASLMSTRTGFQTLYQLCIPGINPTWSQYIIPLWDLEYYFISLLTNNFCLPIYFFVSLAKGLLILLCKEPTLCFTDFSLWFLFAISLTTTLFISFCLLKEYFVLFQFLGGGVTVFIDLELFFFSDVSI